MQLLRRPRQGQQRRRMVEKQKIKFKLFFSKTGGANLHQQQENTEGFVLTENGDNAYWPKLTLFGRRRCCFGARHYITATWAVHGFELMQQTLLLAPFIVQCIW